MQQQLSIIKLYCIDTSALIDLERHYPKIQTAFKAIWEEIEQLIKEGSIFTIETVQEEIEKYQGKEVFLKKWIFKHRRQFIIQIDSQIWKIGQKITAEHPEILDKKKIETGENQADPFLIALAISKVTTIITNENKDKPNKIPLVAAHYGVKSIDLFEFFGERDLKFVKE